MRVNGDHWDLLLNFCDRHHEIITNRSNGLTGRRNLEKLWADLTNQLNSLGFGTKSVSEWKKTLADANSKVKNKAVKINIARNRTGGGPQLDMTLTAREERLLSLMGMKSIGGDSVLEFGLTTKKELLQICSQEALHKTTHQEITKDKQQSVKKRVYMEEFEEETTDWESQTPTKDISKGKHPINKRLYMEAAEENIGLQDTSKEVNCEVMEYNKSQKIIYTVEELEEEITNCASQTPKKAESFSHTRGSKHRKQKLELSESLLQMNENTLSVLKSIDTNISNISINTAKISDAIVKISEKICN